MRRLQKIADFRKGSNNTEHWYDVEYDAVLIEQSIAKQYHVLPSEQENLRYSDWAKMVSGLMDDTPLGRIVSIRSEKYPEMLKHFTKEQKQIRAEWAAYKASQIKDNKDATKQIADLERMIAGLFGR